MDQTISFRVVKEPYGWAVRMGEGMMTPFCSRVRAIQHATSVVEALRRGGECAEVVVEETWATESVPERRPFLHIRRQS